ncbi:MAG: hypothetical protein HYX92_20895 [Chloroflexi bacterium]|nr:hypothetical protein [Chloroflexota bacterium]
MAAPVFEVVWPLGKSTVEPLHLAGRSEHLQGKTVCQLWDWLFRGDDIFSTEEGVNERTMGHSMRR